MNILVFGNGSGYGGAQTAFRRLVDFLLADGHAVGVICLLSVGEEFPAGVKTPFASRIGNEAPRLRKLIETLRAARRARRHAPDLFITVGLAKSANLIARFLPRRTFRVCQDFISGRSANDSLLVSSTRAFDALAVQAPSMVGALRAQGFDALPLSWLPCFPDPPLNDFSRAERNGDAAIRLAYFGRLAPNKGIDLLLNTLASAKLVAPVTLDIWGGGSERDAWQQLTASLRLDSSVLFRGRYPGGADYARLMCGYDGLVLPSTGIEGLPLILLEAMAYGVPFLTTRVGAIPDCCAANDDAVLVEPNLDALRAGLEEFVSRAAANAFSTARLQRHYETHFSLEVMAKRWREMLADPKNFFSTHA